MAEEYSKTPKVIMLMVAFAGMMATVEDTPGLVES
jgi:hypothetical protein